MDILHRRDREMQLDAKALNDSDSEDEGKQNKDFRIRAGDFVAQ
jgi:hypothetical protein